ncbi:MAG: hypothetical protein JSS83_26125, partial [Cyanobacteria bacterium SZAS LIN-3]|nr:hypothetical protein [Cyanobacteria bacterium SZAS LIN-3]
MQSHKVTGNPKTVQRSVLTSLSLLVSTNCVLANAPGFPNHSQAPQSSWQSNNAPQFHANAATASNVTGLATPNAHPVFTHYAGVQHNHQAPNPTFAAHQAAQSAWQSYGLAPDSLQALTTGNFNAPNQGYQLDLSSTTANVVLGTKLFNGAPSVTVDIGGQSVSFRPGAQVTAAEYVAIKEVLSGGQQSIVLNSGGTAVGGTFSLNQVITPKVTELVIPQSVTALDYFSGNKPVTIHGDLVNFGSIYGISTNPAVTSGSIFAHDITNEAGGLITTQLPSAMSSSIADVVSGVSLILGASNNLTNSGTISSAGHLTLATLDGAITNNAGATLTAAQNVNLLPGTGNVNNAGTIAAASGNINIAALNQANNININAAGGTFSALNGAINVRDAAYDGDADINMEGGNYQSQSLNLYGGNGAITGSVGEVSGTLNTSGNAAHFAADTKLLVLGNNCLKGDPTFANAGGDIKISGTVSAAEDLTIVASGNITADPGSSLSTANAQVSGVPFSPSTNITLIAGAKVTTTGSSTSTVPGTSIGSGKTATVDFSSGTGGNIDLQGASIDTSSNVSFLPPSGFYNQPNGGNVLLVAYANGATGGNVSTGSIDTRSQNGNGGNVTVIAGAAPSTPATTTVDLGDIRTGSNGNGNEVLGSGGNVSIYTQQPAAATGSTIVFNNDGSVSSGKVVPAGPVSSNAVVKLTTIDTTTTNFFSSPSQSTTGGDIKIVAGGVDLKVAGGGLVTQAEQSGSVYINAVGAVNANGNAINTAAINGSNVVHSGNITIEAGSATLGDLTAGNTSASTATGGKISITTVDNLVTATVDAGSAGVSAADVILSAGGDLQVNSVNPGSAIIGRNIVLAGAEGISVNAAGGATTTAILSTSSVTALAGSSKSPAAISITGGISTKASRAGGVEIVNNSPTTSAVNVTVGGTIVTDSNSKNGAAGGVSVVSSGAIKLGNISTTSLVSNSTSASGGGVFISSGGTGTNAITVGTVNTSATAAAGNVAGNIIMISPGSKTATNPTNIKHGTVTLNGGQKGVALFASIDATKAPDVIPGTINITTTITGPNAINIRPGGYQSAQGPTSFTINNSNLNMTVPINVSTSLDVNAITQANGKDSFSLATGGNLVFHNNFSSSAQTGNISLLSLGGIETKNSSNINLISQSNAVLLGQSGITADGLTVTAFNDIIASGVIDTSSAAGNGHQVTLNSTIGSISTDNISTFGTGVGATSGGVTLVTLGSVSTGNIDSASHDGGSGFNTTGAGNITMVAGTGTGSTNNAIRTGDLLNSGSGLINLSAAGNRSTIKTGDIISAYSTTSSIDSVVINGNGFVRTGDITTSAATGNSGSVAISMGQTGAQLGVIDTSSSIGAVAGNITINGGGANTTISLQSLNASTNGTNQTGGSGGTVLITNSGGNLTWAQGGINASASYTGSGNGNAGSVLISVNGSLYGTSIQANSVSTSGNGGTVLVSGGKRVFISTTDTSAFSGSSTAGTGGNVTIGSTGGISTTAITTKGFSQGGSISELAGSFIVNNAAVDTSSQSIGGSFSAVTNVIFYSPSNIKTAASNTNSVNATGGNVMIAVEAGNIMILGSIDSSAKSQGGSTLGGSIGMVAATSIDSLQSINASSTTTGGASSSIAGDIFLSAGTTIGSVAIPVALNANASGAATPEVGISYVLAGTSSNFTSTGPSFTATTAKPVTGSNFTIHVTPDAALNVQPGVYSGVGTSANPVNLTLDFGGDSRLLVPIVSNSGVFLSGLTADNTVGGTVPFAVNGYDAHFISYSGSTADSTRISGNLTSTPFKSGTAGNIQFFDIAGSISQSAGLISANQLTLQGFAGIGTTATFPRTVKAINTDAAFVSAATFANPVSVYDVNITTPSTGITRLDGINIASGNNAKFNLTSTGTGASITVDPNSVLMGSLTTIKATGASSSTTVSGAVVGYDEFAKTTIQTGVLNVSSTGRVSASTILIDTTDVINNGLISTTTGTLAVNNSSLTSPNLTISGTGTMTSATALSISAGGNIDFGGLIKGGSLTMQPGEGLLIVAGGNITATAAGGGNFSIDNSSTGGNGGNVIMMAGVKYQFLNGTFNDLTVDTNDLASTTGGSIFLDGSKNANGMKLTNIDTSSTGGAGGTVMFIAQGPSATDDVILLPTNGTITTGGATANGDVAIFALGPTLTGTGKAVAVGDINTGGAGFATGSGGIDLESCTLVPGGNISTQTIVFSNGTFSTNNQPGVIPQTRTGGKGTVTSGKLATNSGYVFVEAESDVTVLFDSSSTLNANDIELTSINGTLTLPVDTLTATAAADGSGGTIILSAPTITYANSGTNPLILTANALDNSSGNGGAVEYITTNSNPISFGKAAGNIQMYAHSGLTGGDGGTVFVTNGGDLGLDSKFYDAAARGANGSGSYFHFEGKNVTINGLAP